MVLLCLLSTHCSHVRDIPGTWFSLSYFNVANSKFR